MGVRSVQNHEDAGNGQCEKDFICHLARTCHDFNNAGEPTSYVIGKPVPLATC